MASLHRDGKRWRVAWRQDGRQRTKRCATKREALEFIRQLDAVDAQQLKPGRRISLAMVAADYMQHRRSWSGDPAWAAKDRRAIDRALEMHGWQWPGDIRAADLERLPVGQFRLIKAVLRHAARMGCALDAAVIHARAPQRHARPPSRLVTDSEASEACRAALLWGWGEGLAVHLVATYGHRPQSIASMQISDWDDGRGIITMAIKDGSTHAHPVLPATRELIRHAIGERSAGYLIEPHNGRTWGRGSPLVSWYYHQIGKRVHAHDPGIYALKRYAITRMLDKGLAADLVASVTGHRTPSVLMDRYARTNETRQRRVIDALADSRA